MTAAALCPACQTPLPHDAPMSLCPRCLFGSPPDAPSLLPSPAEKDKLTWIGDYEVLEEFAHGGMGVVYLARQHRLKRIVALKMIRPSRRLAQADLDRFRLEAQAVARLRHENIVEIYEANEHEGQPFFTMAFIRGRSLAKELEERPGPLPLRRAAELMRAIARAMHHAHNHGVLHRDLKPSNILLEDTGKPYVTDFGLAKLEQEEGFAPGPEAEEAEPSDARPAFSAPAGAGPLTRVGQGMGSPGYASPEQARGEIEALNPASDVFSLGAILYRLITGRAPFPTHDWIEFCERVRGGALPKPHSINPAIDADLESVCLKCLEQEPARRYASAQALEKDLNHWLRGEPVVARPIGGSVRALKWIRRHPVVAGLNGALLLCVLLGGLSWTWWQHAGAQRARADAARVRQQLQSAEEYFSQDEAHQALAALASLLREQPTNTAAAERFFCALRQRVLLVPTTNLPRLLAPLEAPPAASPWRLVGIGSNRIDVIHAESGRVRWSVAEAHTRVIRDLRFSPDGTRVLSAAADFTAKIWDAVDGSLLGTLRHSNTVNHVEMSPDGARLVTASRDESARLWNSANAQPLGVSMRHRDSLNTARFSPDGLRIVTSGDDGTLRVWDGATGQARSEWARSPSAVEDAWITADNRHVVTRQEGGRLQGFLLSQSGTSSPLTSEELALLSADVPSPNLVARTNLWPQVARRHSAPLTASDVTSDGRFLATGHADNQARLWDAQTIQPVFAPLVHDAVVNCVRFSPDGLHLVTGTVSRKVRIWDVTTGLPLCDWIESPDEFVRVQFSASGGWVLCSAGWKWSFPRCTPPLPAWLADFADALAAGNDLQAIESLIERPADGDDRYTHWIREFTGKATPWGQLE